MTVVSPPKKTAFVGIVIVSYNASVAVRTTLASLRQTNNNSKYRLLLIDNASDDLERESIRMALEKHVLEASVPWEYIQQNTNLGFSGGNNIGIRRFLEDPDITHICLLNSDVIVTDYWLDRLIDANSDIVSGVTNKADSEQCVPIDYDINLEDCLDKDAESIPGSCLSQIQKFSQDWYAAWKGNLVEVDVTFFCVLISVPVFEQIGLLDEQFFPGGFEDDDFCLRARKYGLKIHLARDVFIHHWGSASFGKLQYEYFSGRAKKNLEYLEGKHDFVWERRPEKPFVSYLMDLSFACSNGGDKDLRSRFNNLYASQLGCLIEGYESDFSKLSNMYRQARNIPDLSLLSKIKHATSFGNLARDWRDINSDAKEIFESGPAPQDKIERLLPRIERLIEGVRERVKCSHEICAFLPGLDIPVSLRIKATTKLHKLFWVIRRGVPFLLSLRGIVFFGGYPYPERRSDGYFQRIQIVDKLFKDYWRVYVESDVLPGRDSWFDRPEPKVLVLRINGPSYRRAFVRMLALAAVLRCRRIYYHSVLRMRDNRFGLLMFVPGLVKVIDVHGVVPEEFRMHNDFYSAGIYDREERLAVKKSTMAIVVSNSMQNYLQQKYRKDLRSKVVVYPMFPRVSSVISSRPFPDGKPVVVYAGGLHKWQQVDKMIDAIIRTVSICAHRFYCSEPETVLSMLPDSVRSQVTVEYKPHEELMHLYAECHYGFILRDDSVVNHVACPTKLVEYLATGIVPIVDCEDIGDFSKMGMQYLTLSDFLNGNLPGEVARDKMAVNNYKIYESLNNLRKQSEDSIRFLLTGDKKSG